MSNVVFGPEGVESGGIFNQPPDLFSPGDSEYMVSHPRDFKQEKVNIKVDIP